MTSQVVRFRPFSQAVDVGDPPTALLVKGEIVRDSFVLTALGQRFVVPIVDAAADERGPYVLLSEGVHEAPSGWRLVIEPEPDEFLPDEMGAQISFEFGDKVRAATNEALRERGIDPESVNVLGARSDRGLSVYFDSDGQVDGPLPAVKQQGNS